MAKVTKIKDYKVTSGDVFFFDNNVWMFLFASIAGVGGAKQKAYSSLLADIQAARATIFISSLIISEYMNRCLRLRHKQWEERTGKINTDYKKEYKLTSDFKDAVETVKAEIRDIMKLCLKTSDNFNVIEVDEVFKKVGDCDFNDAYYVEMCKLGKYKLVTDDSDLINVPDKIDVITYNIES